MRRLLLSMAVLTLAAMSSPAHAQIKEEMTAEIDVARERAKQEAEARAKQEKKDGWSKRLSVGSTFAFNTSRNVVGSPDGETIQLSVLVDGALELRHGRHEWLNELKGVHSRARTPVLPRFVKTADQVDFKSTYFHSLKEVSWLGPFARFTLISALFPGYVVQAEDVTLRYLEADGTVSERGEDLSLLAGDVRQLSTSFEPTLLKEVVGVFANPIDKGDKVKLNFHLGLGASELLTEGGAVLADDKNTPELDVKYLQDYTQVGAELEVTATGAFNTYLLWSGTFTVFQPLYSSQTTDDRSGIELINVDAQAKISAKLAKWASIDYVFGARFYPLIVDKWQLQNGVLLTATFNLL